MPTLGAKCPMSGAAQIARFGTFGCAFKRVAIFKRNTVGNRQAWKKCDY